jgi:hypothetical protein
MPMSGIGPVPNVAAIARCKSTPQPRGRFFAAVGAENAKIENDIAIANTHDVNQSHNMA